MTISYKNKTANLTTVHQDGKQIGEIRKVAGGYQYFKNGATTGGQIQPTELAVHRTLDQGAV